MSLQVWLPLNGDLHNQGLDPAVFSKTTENVWGSGKIGEKALLTSTGTNKIMVNGLKNKQKFSIAFWVKIDTTLNFTNYYDIWALEYTNATGTGLIRFEHTSTPGSCSLVVYKETNIGENNNAYYYIRGYQDYSSNVWYHLVLTKDQNSTKCYINGNLTNTIFNNQYEASLGKLTGNVTIGASTCAAYLNDVRIYDHCLSPKEIEEISKGLILHYSLNNNGLGNTNLALNTFYEMRPYTIPSYYIRTNNTSTDFFNLSVGDTYTCRVKITAGEKNTCLRIQFYTDNNTKVSISGNWITAGTTGYSTITSTLTTEQRNYSRMEILLSDGVNASTSGVYGELKLEKGSIATPWCPNNINTNIIYDTSGYCNNGTIVGDITTITPSPRYNCATNFINNTSGIKINNNSFSSILNLDFTFSFWIKSNDQGRSIYFGNYSKNPAFNIEKKDNNSLRLYWNGSPDIEFSNTTITNNEWVFITIVKFSTGTIKAYLNGVEKAATGYEFTSQSFSSPWYIGRDSRGDNTAYLGNMSDFRIYCTALTDSQIKELYNTSMQIDSSGNVFARELVEL